MRPLGTFTARWSASASSRHASSAGWLDAAGVESVWAAARAETAAAEEFAATSPDPDPATALDYVYTPPGEVRL